MGRLDVGEVMVAIHVVARGTTRLRNKHEETSLACFDLFLIRKLETAYWRMEMFISFYKGEIERD